MSKKLITAPRLAWAGIVIAIVLALLFLPGIRKRSAQQQNAATPAGEESARPSPSNVPAPMPADSRALDSAAAPSPGVGFRAGEAPVLLRERPGL